MNTFKNAKTEQKMLKGLVRTKEKKRNKNSNRKCDKKKERKKRQIMEATDNKERDYVRDRLCKRHNVEEAYYKRDIT